MRRESEGIIRCTEQELELLSEVFNRRIDEVAVPVNKTQSAKRVKRFIRVLSPQPDKGLVYYQFYCFSGPATKAEKLNTNRPKGGLMSNG